MKEHALKAQPEAKQALRKFSEAKVARERADKAREALTSAKRESADAMDRALAKAREAHALSLHQRDQAILGHSSSSFPQALPAPVLPIASPAAPTTSAPTQVPGRAGQMGKRAAEAEEDAEEAELELGSAGSQARPLGQGG